MTERVRVPALVSPASVAETVDRVVADYMRVSALLRRVVVDGDERAVMVARELFDVPGPPPARVLRLVSSR